MSPSPLRYEPIVKIASGGMATVYLGALRGELGFRQLVAIKRPHGHLLEDAAFRATLMTEARLAARVHHANVVGVRDVEVVGDSVQLVMDYVAGASLGDLIVAWSSGGARVAPAVAVRVVLDACAGLHAAHELADDAGRPLGLVHRDVSPQNVLVGVDGVARVADFGIAKCVEVSGGQTTQGALKGKVGYMAPEYVRGAAIDRRADVFALGVVLWEALVGKRLFRGANEGETLERLLSMKVPALAEASEAPDVAALDAVVQRALVRDRDARFATAEEMRAALDAAARAAGLVADAAEVGRHVRAVAGAAIEARERAAREPAAEIVARVAPVATPASEAETRVEVPRPRRSRAAMAIGGVIVAAAATTAIVVATRAGRVTDATATTTAIATTTPNAPTSATATTTTTASASASATPSSSSRPRVAPPRASTPPAWPPPNPYPR